MYSNFYRSFSSLPFMGRFSFGILGLATLLLVIALKGIALWHAAKREDKWWFILMLVVNTAGLLELVYIIFFAKVKFEELFSSKDKKI